MEVAASCLGVGTGCDTSLFPPGQEAIQLDGEIFFALLRRACPIAYRHLKKFKIDPILYMTEWFMCVFSRTLPWSSVLRVWDMFFCEGESFPPPPPGPLPHCGASCSQVTAASLPLGPSLLTHRPPLGTGAPHLRPTTTVPVVSPNPSVSCPVANHLPPPTPPGVKIIFRVGLVLLRSTLGSVDKLRSCQGMYETMEKLRNPPLQCLQEEVLVHEVSQSGPWRVLRGWRWGTGGKGGLLRGTGLQEGDWVVRGVGSVGDSGMWGALAGAEGR